MSIYEYSYNGKQFINPHRKFLMAPLPNWLLCRQEISYGAKCLYARLVQHAGQNAQCFPKEATLARELGCSKRSIARYKKQLMKYELIATTRLGKRCSNRYFFPHHEWMEFYEPKKE